MGSRVRTYYVLLAHDKWEGATKAVTCPKFKASGGPSLGILKIHTSPGTEFQKIVLLCVIIVESREIEESDKLCPLGWMIPFHSKLQSALFVDPANVFSDASKLPLAESLLLFPYTNMYGIHSLQDCTFLVCSPGGSQTPTE